jgi:hypothetical protein
MDQCEALTNQYLVCLGFDEITYEPSGKNPPDFLLNGRIAVEVRRLNQNELTGSGFRGLEEVRIPTEARIRRLLTSLGPAKLDTSWFANYELKRPVPAWKEIETELRQKLEEFRDDENRQIPFVAKAPGVEIQVFHKASRPHSTFFVYGGGCDEDTGGWVFSETQKNLRLCIEKKTRQIARVRHTYPEWWLVLVDYIGYGVEACDHKLFRELLEIDHNWDKVILLSPLDPKFAFEVPSRKRTPMS